MHATSVSFNRLWLGNVGNGRLQNVSQRDDVRMECTRTSRVEGGGGRRAPLRAGRARQAAALQVVEASGRVLHGEVQLHVAVRVCRAHTLQPLRHLLVMRLTCTRPVPYEHQLLYCLGSRRQRLVCPVTARTFTVLR